MAPRQSSNKKQRKTEDHHREELKIKKTTSNSKVFNYNFSMNDFSHEEREIADVLLLLQILEPQYPFKSTKSPSRNPLPLPPPWGRRKRRSAINVTPSPSPPREPIPVVQPSLPPPCSKEDERIVKKKKTSPSTTPNTPLSLSSFGSGSESPSNNMEEQQQQQILLDTLTQLTIQIRNLKTEIPKVRHRRNKLMEVNGLLQNMLAQTERNMQVR
ncbi:hypothetical protein FRX31_017042 [Thalictrum thalictroides]|uniref:Uncharacterized protein n=1 Tax=Thalictrum thalictroides TaxID=46969 RepID=A0A7J6W964_THATH|nr:hypothetical protein FRX31_017042 [Thalictrum thalictroides]